MWYGTNDSSLQCIRVPKVNEIQASKVTPYIKLQGLPHITEYHVMNNKRFVLTKDTQQTVQLWQLDSAKCIHTFNQPWDECKKLLSEMYDLKSEKGKLPSSWMTVDVKLGCLNVTLEENYWNKASVPHGKTDLDSLLHGKDSPDDTEVNLGLELLKKCL